MQVYFADRVVGWIEPRKDGLAFHYDPQWLDDARAFPLSLGIPLTPETVGPEVFVPWIANLLPEGPALRRIGQLLGMAPEDLLAMLGEIGRDTAGALSIGAPGTTRSDYREIETDADLERIIGDLPRKPFLVGEEGVSMSLAGVQTKLGVFRTQKGTLAIPFNGSPSTHILKPDAADRLYGSVQNEAYCMTLARLAGLDAAEVTTGRAGERNYLLVTRYDRQEDGNSWRRLHQEDFCQALGKPPEAKYERNQTGIKGPSAVDMLRLSRAAVGAPAVVRLLDGIVFNIVACNTDAHAKNYAIMLSPGAPRLAPLYDVLATQVWGGITPNLAQSIAGKTRGDHLKQRHWIRFAEDAGLARAAALRRIHALIGRVEKAMPAARSAVRAMPAGDHPMLDDVAELIKKRIAHLRTGLEDDRLIDD
ncbi:MAG: serine/threonine protein kinase HipA [Alphaproteobacteria bacterium 32-64-14]|nr:MAG: serine/threonine protein kinase HipA [Alphaproteobacteria bacterium 32-64-14]